MSRESECGMDVLHDEFLQTLTRDQFIEFRNSIKSHPNSKPPPYESHTPMTTFTGHIKPPPFSESQIALNNSKRATKRNTSAYPIFKNDLYYDTFQRSFLAIIKAQGLYDVANPDFEPDDGDQYAQELFQEKQSFVYSVLVTSLQTEKGRELVKELKEMQNPSFQSYTIIILSQMWHNMRLLL